MDAPDINTFDPASLFSVKGKVALITGASGGLGSTAARALAKAGARVMLTGRTADKLLPIVAQIEADGGEARSIVARPDDPDDVKQTVEATAQSFGGLDILITAAGLNHVHPITEFSLDAWEEVMDVNVKGSWLSAKEAGKVMIAQGRGGKVILVSSARSTLGMANYTAYSPSKAAIDLLAKSLACEWGKHKINVNAIAPTVFRTELTQWMFDDQDTYKRFLGRIPIGRLAEPEDFIGTLIYLASRASDFMTGAVVHIDGGYTAG